MTPADLTAADLTALAPLIVLGVAIVVSMLLAPKADAALVRYVAALGPFAAMGIAVMRLGTPSLPMPALLVDDGFARLGVALVAATGLACLIFLRPALPAREGPPLMVLATLGGAVLAMANHAATVFLGLEIITLSLLALTVLPRSNASLEAAYKLLILGAIGAAALLLGFALAYAETGDLSLRAWSGSGMLVRLGAALLLAGIAFKFSLVPFHMWTPDLFSGAPPAVAAFAGVASKVAVAVVLIRLAAAPMPEPVWSTGLAAIGVASILLGNIQALRQPSLVRMLGYSAVAHSGYVAVILASGAPLGAEAALFYLASYAPGLIAAFCVAAGMGGAPMLDDLRGLIWRSPIAGAALALALLSLAGLPASVGFLGKFYLFTALIEAEAWALLAAAAVGSALGLYFYMVFMVTLFRRDDTPRPTPQFQTADTILLLTASGMIAALGVNPNPLVNLVRLALP
ncbi:MAG: NADH-quinone oxidoreductase subunit N [Rhodobacteraceae bacterium]|nr:NADH-quinone oxidoreductase subunit N [Paracoccaceae bacterium]